MKKLNAVIVIVTVVIFSSCISSHNASLKFHKVNSVKSSNKVVTDNSIFKNSLESHSLYDEAEIIEVKNKVAIDSECDQLILRNGERKLVEILFLGKEKLRYKDCPGSKSGEETVATNEIDSLIFTSGTAMVFNIDGTIKETDRKEINVFKENSLKSEDFPKVIGNEEKSKNNNYKDDASLDNSMAKLISTLSGLSFIPVFGLIFSILVFIKAKTGIQQIDKNPEKYSGKRKIINSRRLAILSLSIGAAIVLFFGIVFLIALL